MGMSTHVVGFIPPDDEWYKMKAIWVACQKADVEIPAAVQKFFDYDNFYPGDEGREVAIPYTEYTDEYREGIQIEINELPAHVKTIRFFNSW